MPPPLFSMFSTKRCKEARPCFLMTPVSVFGEKTLVARTMGGPSPFPVPDWTRRAAVELRRACDARRGEPPEGEPKATDV